MIDFGLLQESIDFYQNVGFKRIETPWTVSPHISGLTKPEGSGDFIIKHNNKCLVASAEQGFISLINKGFLTDGWYQSCTPCFRDEDFTTIHTKYFMKNELIIIGNHVTEETVDEVVDHAKDFFEGVINSGVNVEKTDIGYDIEYKGVEIGSYGIRDLGFVKYVYGTGCSLPRLTRVQKLKIT